jgi:enoyl-CoA hydratase/carnithine racemase
VNYGKYKEIDIKLDGRIATVTLNRPQKLNAVNSALHTELAHSARAASRSSLDADAIS